MNHGSPIAPKCDPAHIALRYFQTGMKTCFHLPTQKQIQSLANERGVIRLDEGGIDAKKSVVVRCNWLDRINVFQG